MDEKASIDKSSPYSFSEFSSGEIGVGGRSGQLQICLGY